MTGSRTPMAEQSATEQPMTEQHLACKSCGRPVRLRKTKAAAAPGTVVVDRRGGNCQRCKYRSKPPETIARKKAGANAEAARDVAARIAAARAARGIPADGVARIRIVNSRGRILRVPQPA